MQLVCLHQQWQVHDESVGCEGAFTQICSILPTSTTVTGKWTQLFLPKGTQMIHLLLHIHRLSCIRAFMTIFSQEIMKAHAEGNSQLAIV